MEKNKKVLLLNTNLMKPPIDPIGLDYIGGVLTRNGFDVELLDYVTELVNQIIENKLGNKIKWFIKKYYMGL